MRVIPREPIFIFPPDSLWLLSLPSEGNVGQLAVDVILATLFSHGRCVERVGVIETDLVLPISGYDSLAPKAQRQLCMPVEG